MNLAETDARKAILVLLSRGRLRPTEVAAAVRAHDRMVSELRKRLAALEALGKDGPFPMRVRGRSGIRKARRTLKSATAHGGKRVSASRKAAMIRQGKYLAAIRRLNAQSRAKVKSVLTSKGWSAAMAEAKRMKK
jgi:hypothetical protein